MVDYLAKFYEKLVSSVLDPVQKWILGLSWPKRVLILCALSAGLWIWKHPALAEDAAGFAERTVRVVMADADRLPLDEHLTRRVAGARARLSAPNRNDAYETQTGGVTGWSAAQILLAIAGWA